ncbi:hypothetical protein SISSUDRAFT_91855 [Sistotremastrum suecicum HHB10207 ss-3]|uniref:Uncharacterized protein n=1 Tax=Sistotremastrum suecicum HHB10207 ss-3 TaxID=1314776 RepID=A0A166B988_9AGAM|nr:hypothetical protein SISSUDRAFT_91855 [Sistotremastrum suecicum HHB10207 ss-3]
MEPVPACPAYAIRSLRLHFGHPLPYASTPTSYTETYWEQVCGRILSWCFKATHFFGQVPFNRSLGRTDHDVQCAHLKSRIPYSSRAFVKSSGPDEHTMISGSDACGGNCQTWRGNEDRLPTMIYEDADCETVLPCSFSIWGDSLSLLRLGLVHCPPFARLGDMECSQDA